MRRRYRRTKRGKVPGHRVGIAETAEQAKDAGGVQAGKEVLQVEAEDDGFPDMPLRCLEAIASGDETEGVRVIGQMGKQTVQDVPLRGFEALFRGFEQAGFAIALWDKATVIVVDGHVAMPLAAVLRVGQCGEAIGLDQQPIRERGQCRQPGQIKALKPVDGGHLGLGEVGGWPDAAAAAGVVEPTETSECYQCLGNFFRCRCVLRR